MLSKVDEKGRICLGKKLGKRLGEEVFIVELKDGVLLVPKPADPLKMLQTLGASLPDVPTRELLKEITGEAKKETGCGAGDA